MKTHVLKGSRRTMAAAGLVLASVAGVLVATTNSAQAAAPGFPLTVCYASNSSNPERRVLFGSAVSGGNVGYWVQREAWSRSTRKYEFRSRTWVSLANRGDALRSANARCSYFTFGAFPISG